MKTIDNFLISTRTLIIVCSIAFAFGALYNLVPFLYSKDFLVQKTKEDLNEFIKSEKVIEDKRFTFLSKENNLSCAVNKYVPYSICKCKTGGVK